MICRKTSISAAFVIFAALALLLLTSGASALYNSGGGSWQYNREITINNPGTGLSDYQIIVTLDSSNFNFSRAQGNGKDIRFTDAVDAELNYWIESWGAGGAKIWVKVTSVPTGTSTIHMYYGNPSAESVSDGENTFEFFDDFEGPSLKIEKWDVKTGANYLLSNGVIKIVSNSFGYAESDYGVPAIYSKVAFNDYVIQARVTHDTDNSLGDINYWLFDDSNYYAIQHETRASGTDTDLIYKTGVTKGYLTYYSYEWNVNEWVKYTIKVHSSIVDFERISENNFERKNFGTDIGNERNLALINRKIGLSGDALYGNFIVDWIFIHKYAPLEPNLNIGTEKPLLKGPSLTLAKSATPSTLFEGDTTTITIRVENTGSDGKNVKIVDAIPQGFTLVSGTTSQEYPILKATEYRTFQYTIKAIGTGRFITDLATITYLDDKGNSYSGASNSATITVQGTMSKDTPTSNLPQPKEPKSIPGFEAYFAIIAWGLFLISWRRL